MVQPWRCTLAAAAMTLIVGAPGHGAGSIQTTCSNGTDQAVCQVERSDDTWSVTLANGQRLQARRLGRWSRKLEAGATLQSCNVRIDLGDEIVYGLLTISTLKGTTLIWPQGRIEIAALKQ